MKYRYKYEEIHKTNINDYPKDFDVKDVDENLNVCNKCGIIVVWYNEMYWSGEECQETNDILGSQTVIGKKDKYGEFIAESFCAYMKGERSNIFPELLKLFDEASGK